MAIPIDLNNALENQLNQIINMQNINEKAKSISERYRKNDNDGKRLLTESDEAVAYGAAIIANEIELVIEYSYTIKVALRYSAMCDFSTPSAVAYC